MKSLINDERGQALPLVLVMLTLGSLVIVPALNYAATSLSSVRSIRQKVSGLYAAESGVEYTLWCLKNSTSPPAQLAEAVDRMDVGLVTVDKGGYTLYFGGLVQTEGHSDYLAATSEIVWEEAAQAYKYTITVTWQPDSGVTVIHLEEVGARIPEGYSYQGGSAAGFAENLSAAEPGEVLDEQGAYLLQWAFDSPYPDVSQSDPVASQAFYITGEGELEGDYTWVVANRSDIGEVGEVTGTLYEVTATATHPGDSEATAEIMATVMIDGGSLYIISWQIVK
ncbi:hypothetical protein ACFLU4_01185 [Chloroflexota bacterium]